jgi:6-phosphogluconate dehydrogenase
MRGETMADKADIGVMGLAVMGANLARNAAHHGFGVAVFNRNPERTDALIADHGKEGRFFPAKELPEFIASIAKPRPILIMVKAGKPVDEVIDELCLISRKTTLSSTAATRCSATPRGATRLARRKKSASSAWASLAARRARSKAPA